MDANILTLETLFKSPVSYRIPQFQRPYAWKKEEQWKPLWDDVCNVVERILASQEEYIPPHFMGAIVLQGQETKTGEVDKRIVVDGQQRLTTLQLLMRATVDAFQSLDDTERAKRLEELTLNLEEHWGGDSDNQTKIRQSNVNDQRAFQRAIRGSGVGEGRLSSIEEAFVYFKGEITDWLNKDPANRPIHADALEKALKSYLQIAAIDLDKGEKPHFIFAVLNTRAEPLKQSDHIKNTVMYEGDVIDDGNKARELWGMFDTDDWWRQDTREGRLTRIHLDRFLNYWIVMQLGQEVTAERVSPEFSKFVEQKKQAANTIGIDNIKKISASIREAGLVYKDLEECKIAGIETFLKRIKILEQGVVMPPLLWLYTNDVVEEKRRRSLMALESYLVRRMLCGLGSTGLNRFFVELVGKLKSEGTDRADTTVIEFLSNTTVDNRIWPKDNMLAEYLIGWPLRGSVNRQKMVLEAIEMSLRTGKTEDLGQNKNLTLEHIMPQSWRQHWPLSSDDEEAANNREKAIKEIGNLTLVTDKLNPSLSNAPWSEKRDTLKKHTTMRLNWELLEEAPDSWDESAIHERSRQLTESVKEVWPYADRL